MAELKSGYTTGACAAAGVKAAILYLHGQSIDRAELQALDGTPLFIPIKQIVRDNDTIWAEIIKYSGDDPDITNGSAVWTGFRLLPEQKDIVFRAGEGIGTVTKAGLSVPVGQPAINPGPRQLIKKVIQELLGSNIGCEITISIPNGAALAAKTLNPLLGVEGGLSVIGTTGVLRPMSEQAFKDALVPQIDVAKALDCDSLVFVPGKIGLRIARDICGLPEIAIVQTSNFIGFMLEKAVEKKIRQVLLLGHIGKIAKVAAGVFYTHNRIADARLETMAAYAAALAMPVDGIKAILASATTEAACKIIEKYHLEKVYELIAERASIRSERYVFNKLKIGTLLADLQGNILGKDSYATKIGQGLGWNIK